MKRQTLIVSSREEDGAKVASRYNIGAAGIVSNDEFTITREENFDFRQYDQLFVSVPTATIWYNTPNIYARDYPNADRTRNNQLVFKYWESRDLGAAIYDGLDDAGSSNPAYPVGGRVRTITFNIPEGLYNLDLLNQSMNDYFVQQLVPSYSGVIGIYGVSDQIVFFEGNSADSKVVVHLQKPSSTFPNDIPLGTIVTSINFTALSPNDLLGVNIQENDKIEMLTVASSDITKTSEPQESLISILPKQAKFNTTEYYYINSNIVDAGIPVNGKGGSVICMVTIDKDQQIGTQIKHNDYNKQYIDATSITRGQPRKELAFWLTDQFGKRVNTMGEDWSCRIDFEGTLKPEVANKRPRSD
jgi:hypothetical protein